MSENIPDVFSQLSVAISAHAASGTSLAAAIRMHGDSPRSGTLSRRKDVVVASEQACLGRRSRNGAGRRRDVCGAHCRARPRHQRRGLAFRRRRTARVVRRRGASTWNVGAGARRRRGGAVSRLGSGRCTRLARPGTAAPAAASTGASGSTSGSAAARRAALSSTPPAGSSAFRPWGRGGGFW